MSIQKAVQKLNDGCCCAVYKNGRIISAEGTGVKPILSFLQQDRQLLNGASVADQVIGKAAALLFVYGGAKEIYGKLMSETAMAVLEKYQVPYSFEKSVPFIKNRRGDGMCPMEQAVAGIDNPKDGFAAIMQKIAEGMGRSGRE